MVPELSWTSPGKAGISANEFEVKSPLVHGESFHRHMNTHMGWASAFSPVKWGECFCSSNVPGLCENRELRGPGEQNLEARQKFCFVLFLEALYSGGGGRELLVMKSTHAHLEKTWK